LQVTNKLTHFFHIDDLASERAAKGEPYLEFLRVPALSAGVYVLAAGVTDPQKPHHEDELYYVVRGRARMQIGSEHADVRAGSVIFVESEREHRFYDIREELEILVFFAPAEQQLRPTIPRRTPDSPPSFTSF
jgi:mannose-6-phosphate isomerase-like protein (cupin superfamily)